MKQVDFSVKGKVAVVTGGAGVLGSNIAKSLASAGAKIVIIDIREEKVDEIVVSIKEITDEVKGYVGSVLDIDELNALAETILKEWGSVDILVNAAGGNLPGATLEPDQEVFDMKIEDFNKVTDLNLNGTVYPTLAFGKIMARQGSGSVINISSMATYSAITRVPGYSVAKTGINIFTMWMATEMARKYGDKVRVNAIAPGFFIGDQNRNVLINPDGSLTERSKKVIAKTPMGRFGDIDELNGAVQFLCSDAASFITGVVLPVDGGFRAFSGV
ncbi:MAG: SDR family oxidoreductase [Chlorobi bacterium]|nr:SDR family oxidoreductase [Chlorobiota bacterium]